jgi:hypothetical protein
MYIKTLPYAVTNGREVYKTIFGYLILQNGNSFLVTKPFIHYLSSILSCDNLKGNFFLTLFCMFAGSL